MFIVVFVDSGEIARLTDPIDFQKPRRVGEKMSQVGERGYDHNYCLKKTPLLDGDKDLHWAATYVKCVIEVSSLCVNTGSKIPTPRGRFRSSLTNLVCNCMLVVIWME